MKSQYSNIGTTYQNIISIRKFLILSNGSLTTQEEGGCLPLRVLSPPRLLHCSFAEVPSMPPMSGVSGHTIGTLTPLQYSTK